MKYHKQHILHKPDKGIYGDCFRTALACLLDMEVLSVPHFMNDPNEPIRTTWKNVDNWLKDFGFRLISLPFNSDYNELMDSMKDNYPGLVIKLSGKSIRGSNHTIIVKDGKMIHDPHPDNTGLNSPCDDGYYWMDFILPISIHGERE